MNWGIPLNYWLGTFGFIGCTLVTLLFIFWLRPNGLCFLFACSPLGLILRDRLGLPWKPKNYWVNAVNYWSLFKLLRWLLLCWLYLPVSSPLLSSKLGLRDLLLSKGLGVNLAGLGDFSWALPLCPIVVPALYGEPSSLLGDGDKYYDMLIISCSTNYLSIIVLSSSYFDY
jgi:hypothetical protein